jgi:hypothetical protein
MKNQLHITLTIADLYVDIVVKMQHFKKLFDTGNPDSAKNILVGADILHQGIKKFFTVDNENELRSNLSEFSNLVKKYLFLLSSLTCTFENKEALMYTLHSINQTLEKLTLLIEQEIKK